MAAARSAGEIQEKVHVHEILTLSSDDVSRFAGEASVVGAHLMAVSTRLKELEKKIVRLESDACPKLDRGQTGTAGVVLC